MRKANKKSFFETVFDNISNKYNAENKAKNNFKSISLFDATMSFQETRRSPIINIMMHEIYNSGEKESPLVENIQKMLHENASNGAYSLFFTNNGYQSVGRFQKYVRGKAYNPLQSPRFSENEKAMTFELDKDKEIIMSKNDSFAETQTSNNSIINYFILESKNNKRVLREEDLKLDFRSQLELLIPYGNPYVPAFIVPTFANEEGKKLKTEWKTVFQIPHEKSRVHTKKLFNMDSLQTKQEWTKGQANFISEITKLEKEKRETLSRRDPRYFDICRELGIDPEIPYF